MAIESTEVGDWEELGAEISRRVRPLVGVRPAVEEFGRVLEDCPFVVGYRLRIQGASDGFCFEGGGPGQALSLTHELETRHGQAALDFTLSLPGNQIPGWKGFQSLLDWVFTDWLRRLSVPIGLSGGGDAGLLELGSALAGSHHLDQLLETVLQAYVQVAQARGGKVQLLEGGWATSVLESGQQTRRLMVVPLVRREAVKALVTLYLEQGAILVDSRLQLLFGLAQQAALAIENTLNYEREQEQSREAQLLYTVARSIDEGQDLEEVLEYSAAALARVADVRRCLILLRDSQRTYFTVVAATGLSPDQEEFFQEFRLTLSQFPELLRKELTAGRAVSSGDHDLRESALGRLCSLLPGAGYLLVPLVVKDRVIGLIYLDDPRGDASVSEAAKRMVLTLSFQVGNAIQRASLLNQLQENLGPLKALYQVSTAITGTLSLNKVVKLIVEQAVELLEHSACALLVLDEMGEGFRLETSVGLSDELLDPALQARLARAAVERKKATALYLEKDPECLEFEGVLKRANFGGLLTVPLVARKKMVGVLNCFVAPAMRFRQQEIRFLRGFANQAAIAVENARLHGLVRFKMGELGTLFEVSKAVTSTLQLDRVLEEIVRHVRDILRADACSLMLVEGSYLVMKTSEGLDRAHSCRPIPLGKGVAGTAARTGQPTVVLDQHESAESNEFPAKVRAQGLKTILCVPVETRGRVIGLINVYFKELMTHTPAQVNLLIALGSQAAVAIENARLYAEKQHVTELLHDALIPDEKLGFPGVQVGHRFVPSMHLSGDYYDLIPLDEERFFMVIADVSGKGPDAAIHALQAKHILGSYALAGYGPAASLRMLNHQVAHHSARQITVFCAQADLGRGTLRFACAGHEQPLFFRKEDEEPILLQAEGIMIGAIDDYEYAEKQLPISPGSLILLYTDGITEARTPQGEFYGLSRIMQAMVQLRDGHPGKLVNGLYNRVRKFTRENITDDFSLLAVRF